MGADYQPIGGSRKAPLIKNILLGVLAVLFMTMTALFIWQVVSFSHYKKTYPGNAPTPAAYSWIKDDVSNQMNTGIDPCSDFYEYVCGGYEAKTVLAPGELMRVNVFDIIDATNQVIIDGIVGGQWPLLADLMESCMQDPTFVTNDTVSTLSSVASQLIAPLNSTSIADLFPVLAQLHMIGTDAFWVPGVMDNIFVDDSLNYLQLFMGGLSVDRNSYLDLTFNITKLALQVQLVLGITLDDPTVAMARGIAVANFETVLAINQPDPDLLTYEDAFTLLSFQKLGVLAGADYTAYASALGIKGVQPSDSLIVTTPGFFANLTAVLENADLAVVKDYLTYHFGLSLLTNFYESIYPDDGLKEDSVASELKSSLVSNNKHSSSNNMKVRSLVPKDKPVDPATPLRTLRGPAKKRTLLDFSMLRSRLTDSAQKGNCIALVENVLDDFVGLLFSTMVVDQSVRDNIVNMTVGIESAFKNSLSDLTWITPTSKQNSIDKLNMIIQIIGHPNKLEQYRGITLDPTHLLSNVLLLSEYKFSNTLLDVGTPFNRSDYEFQSTIVNAFYSPLTNTINFPAGILESPIFSKTNPKMLNYAHMGFVVGHEMTHGFDNSGRNWDGHGAFKSIMDPTSEINFNEQAQCLVDQYNSYQVLPGYKIYINGEQTLGENIADLGGVKNSFRAYKAWVADNGAEFHDHQIIDSLTNDQLFFVMMGQTWCTKATPTALAYQVLEDVHSPSKWRVNGPLSNFDEFAKAFSCKAGSGMVNNNQCMLW